MGAIFKRELHNYFSSALAYVFLAVFYFFAGFYFYASVLYNNSNDISSVFDSMFMIIMLLVPILTMRLFSEDYKSKTDQLLLTSPVGVHSLVYGKFLAAFTVFSIGSAITLVYAIIMSLFSSMEWFSIIGNILGLLLLGGALISIGMFVSSLTQNQVIAAVGAFGLILVFMYMNSFASIIPVTWLANLFNNLSFMEKFSNFVYGYINIADILYFVSVIVIFNFLSSRTLEKKRWA